MAGAWLGSPTDFYRSGDLRLSYTDYLQRRELDDHLAFQITGSIKELVTQGDSIAHAQISQLQQIEAAQAETTAAVYVVAQAIEDLRHETEQGFRRVGAILEWGFSELIFQQSRTNDLLSDILHALKTPSLTWAYEQFERARDRYRRGHHLEALESLEKAIEGHASELGDKTEHRFHYLRGIIKLGSFQNHEPAVINSPRRKTPSSWRPDTPSTTIPQMRQRPCYALPERPIFRNDSKLQRHMHRKVSDMQCLQGYIMSCQSRPSI